MADETAGAEAGAEAEAWGLTVRTLEPGSYAVRVPGGGGAAVADLKAAIQLNPALYVELGDAAARGAE